jgi:hypothetical protein
VSVDLFPSLYKIYWNHGRKRGPKMKKREEEKRKRKKKTKVYGRGKKIFFYRYTNQLLFSPITEILRENGEIPRFLVA